MGQFPKIHPTEPRMDRFAILAIFLAAAVSAAPLEDTAEVAAAKAEFQAVFKMAAEGKLGELAPVNTDQQAEQIPTAYIADTSDVAAAKAEFASAFALAESGELAQLAPVNNDVQADPVVATYIADTDDVNAAKAKFMAAFEDAKLAAEQAPEAVEEPAAVAAPVVNALSLQLRSSLRQRLPLHRQRYASATPRLQPSLRLPTGCCPCPERCFPSCSGSR